MRTRRKNWALSLLAAIGPLAGFGAGIYKDTIKTWFDEWFGPVMVVSASQIVPRPSPQSIHSGVRHYHGGVRIKNDGLSAGHDISLAIIAPLSCTFGTPKIETVPVEAGPRMNLELRSSHSKFPVNYGRDTKVLHVDHWGKNEELIINYPLTCSKPLEPSKLRISPLNEHIRSREVSSIRLSSGLFLIGDSANDAAAASTIRTINTSEVTYSSTYAESQLLDSVLATPEICPATTRNTNENHHCGISDRIHSVEDATPHLEVLVLQSGGAHLTSTSFVVADQPQDPAPIQDADLDALRVPWRQRILDSGTAHLVALPTIRTGFIADAKKSSRKKVSFTRKCLQ